MHRLGTPVTLLLLGKGRAFFHGACHVRCISLILHVHLQGASHNSGSSGHSSMEASQTPSVSNSAGALMRQSSTVSGEAKIGSGAGPGAGALQVLQAAAARAGKWKADASAGIAGVPLASIATPLCLGCFFPCMRTLGAGYASNILACCWIAATCTVSNNCWAGSSCCIARACLASQACMLDSCLLSYSAACSPGVGHCTSKSIVVQ